MGRLANSRPRHGTVDDDETSAGTFGLSSWPLNLIALSGISRFDWTWIRSAIHGSLAGRPAVTVAGMKADFSELATRFRIREIAVDPWNATQLALQLQGDGFEVVTFGQGFKDMTAPTKEWEKLVISGKLQHGGQPVLRWMASHVSVETDAAGNLKPSKKKSTDRIDGLVAGIMALGRALQQREDHSVYETRGMLVV